MLASLLSSHKVRVLARWLAMKRQVVKFDVRVTIVVIFLVIFAVHCEMCVCLTCGW